METKTHVCEGEGYTYTSLFLT